MKRKMKKIASVVVLLAMLFSTVQSPIFAAHLEDGRSREIAIAYNEGGKDNFPAAGTPRICRAKQKKRNG